MMLNVDNINWTEHIYFEIDFTSQRPAGKRHLYLAANGIASEGSTQLAAGWTPMDYPMEPPQETKHLAVPEIGMTWHHFIW